MVKNILRQNEIQAVSKYIRMAPSKIRRILQQIEGKSYEEALMLLKFLPHASCEPITKVLRSAVANAKHNNDMEESDIIITKAFADKGPVLKRFRPRAQGRAFRILKPTSHITIVVSNSL
uniref:ribosomal protein L22 n=1 Tax=Chrysotila carterae TaxID=13221 RepID=UPI0022F31B05|nr:ribosomal protein L22 [Chrysotila carterae]WAK83186.1 ribosomal protein L22 [Chrysotila carterae]